MLLWQIFIFMPFALLSDLAWNYPTHSSANNFLSLIQDSSVSILIYSINLLTISTATRLRYLYITILCFSALYSNNAGNLHTGYGKCQPTYNLYWWLVDLNISLYIVINLCCLAETFSIDWTILVLFKDRTSLPPAWAHEAYGRHISRILILYV